uniref:Carboxylesterase type B domain-containing protein n=1 Tax=Scylla olivacea TaxID=85551 RepID=A0A0P4VVP4_SCYOL
MMLMTVTVMLAVAAAAATENPHISPALVEVKQGSILGSRVKTSNGFVYYTFSTIPYARPPVGHLRFQVRDIPGELSFLVNQAFLVNCPLAGRLSIKTPSVSGDVPFPVLRIPNRPLPGVGLGTVRSPSPSVPNLQSSK